MLAVYTLNRSCDLKGLMEVCDFTIAVGVLLVCIMQYQNATYTVYFVTDLK